MRTNVLKSDGSRVVGTSLDPLSKAIAAIRQGQPFYGVVDILGTPYFTGHEPKEDSGGRIVGIWPDALAENVVAGAQGPGMKSG